eukprot:CAMPEP_0174746466 /NCGR_PEP_ID=MMETSP1094-20130205/89158_1 /TAXON_ID=156173 /ORGANISM="Chrysochromulina brevifilum, Strain UTEX LB 985" /LENGTH=148 /DNA_ID=CAMNT_0015951181 /DNA_START=385 /DNA_END=829 /DNA_ORIENTATION=-
MSPSVAPHSPSTNSKHDQAAPRAQADSWLPLRIAPAAGAAAAAVAAAGAALAPLAAAPAVAPAVAPAAAHAAAHTARGARAVGGAEIGAAGADAAAERSPARCVETAMEEYLRGRLSPGPGKARMGLAAAATCVRQEPATARDTEALN